MQNNYSWYSDSHSSDAPDHIHQVFAYGTLDDIRKMKDRLGTAKLREYFIKYPKKVYRQAALNFIKKYILEIRSHIDDDRYLKDTPRNIG